MKLCTKCDGYLPDSRFARLRRRDGSIRLASWCHTCTNEGRKRESRWHITKAQQNQWSAR